MADLNLDATESGLSVTASLFEHGEAVLEAIPMLEIANTGVYYADIPNGTQAGVYNVIFFAAGEKIASGLLRWDGMQAAGPQTTGDIVNALEAEGGKIDRAMQAAQSADDQTA